MEKFFFRWVSSVTDGLLLLTVSAKSFSIPMTWSMITLIPKFFYTMANSFISLQENLFELENFVAQQFADVLSPPMCKSGCQLNCIWWFSSAVEAAKMLTTIAKKSSSLIQSLSGWSIGRTLIRRWTSGFQVFQYTCHQYWSWPEPPPILQLVEASCRMLASGTLSTKWISGLIHHLVPFRCLMRCAWR